MLEDKKIAVIGLGYVGLPLALEFGKVFNTIGFDINVARVNQLKKGNDQTLEVKESEFAESKLLSFTCSEQEIRECNIFIITVPTPIDENRRPDLTYLYDASRLVGKILKKNNLVIYESTVYPGATEEFCIPILEEFSLLRLNEGFSVGYSPERINPGDKLHRLVDIQKLTSGSSEQAAELVDDLYKKIIKKGTFRTSSIMIAEAAKIIENTQRDLNIALVNELAIVFNKLGIDTQEVIEAAKTKWNFIPFHPGLVGGHCIGVDPYYLTYKAQSIGYDPQVILSGRRLNDGMGHYIARQCIKHMLLKKINMNTSNILILGLTFKENCSDLRNSKVVDIYTELRSHGLEIDVHDPLVNFSEAKEIYGDSLIMDPTVGFYDVIILAVAHHDFTHFGAEKIRRYGKSNCILYDVKSAFNKNESDIRL